MVLGKSSAGVSGSFDHASAAPGVFPGSSSRFWGRGSGPASFFHCFPTIQLFFTLDRKEHQFYNTTITGFPVIIVLMPPASPFIKGMIPIFPAMPVIFPWVCSQCLLPDRSPHAWEVICRLIVPQLFLKFNPPRLCHPCCQARGCLFLFFARNKQPAVSNSSLFAP
jgi:hypothetical protein